MIKLKFLAVTLLLISGIKVYAQTLPLYNQIWDVMKNQLSNFDATYTIKLTEDSAEIKGRFALYGKSYYDSNNYYFMFQNDSWYFNAMHTNQEIQVKYLPAIRNQLGSDYVVSYVPEFNLTNIDLDQFIIVTHTKKNGVYEVKLTDKSQGNMELTIVIKLPEMRIVSYSVSRIEGKNQLEEQKQGYYFKTLSFINPCDSLLFDSRRFIEEKAGKAKMIKYSKYKIYKANSKSN